MGAAGRCSASRAAGAGERERCEDALSRAVASCEDRHGDAQRRASTRHAAHSAQTALHTQRSGTALAGTAPRPHTARKPTINTQRSVYIFAAAHPWAHGSLALRQHAAPRATRAKSLIPIWGGPVEAVVLARIKREETGARGAHAAASTHCRSRVTDLQDHGRHTTTHRPPQALYGSPRSRARSLTTTASREAATSRRSGAARRCGPSSSSASPAPSRSSSSAASSARCWAAATARRRLR